jgi:hypothetical protein
LFSQQTKTWIHQHLRHGLDNFEIESFQYADALPRQFSQLDFGLGNNDGIEDHSPIFGTFYYRDIFKCIQFLLAHLLFQVHFDFELVWLADSECRRTYSEMNTGHRGWATQEQLPAGATIVPVIIASYETHSTNLAGDQHAWPLYFKIGNIGKDIRHTTKTHMWIPVRLIPCSPKGGINSDDAWHSAVRTVLSPVWNLNITGPGLKWNCADGFQRQ